jgi:hypothetical protein
MEENMNSLMLKQVLDKVTSLEGQIKDVQTSLEGQIKEVQTSLEGQIKEVRISSESQINGQGISIRQEMRNGFEQLGKKIDDQNMKFLEHDCRITRLETLIAK